jgi:hypothetical protein
VLSPEDSIDRGPVPFNPINTRTTQKIKTMARIAIETHGSHFFDGFLSEGEVEVLFEVVIFPFH